MVIARFDLFVDSIIKGSVIILNDKNITVYFNCNVKVQKDGILTEKLDKMRWKPLFL